MSVSRELGAPLVAREQWCAPGEPLLCAVWQRNLAYRIDGYDEELNPVPKKNWGKSVLRGGGKAVAAVGNFAGEALLTLALGGESGGDRGGSGSGPPPPPRDLLIFGDNPECAAVQAVRRQEPSGYSSYRMVWALTPARLGVLVAKSPQIREPRAPQQASFRSLFESKPETFGDNTPGEPIKAQQVAPWLEFRPGDFTECRPVGTKKLVNGCALVLPDGSGFALTTGNPRGAQPLVEAAQRFLAQGSGRG